MIEHIISVLTTFIIYVISSLGYAGVAALMAIESAAIPLPSEVIAPFAGYLVFTGRFVLFWVAIAGGIGSSLGSIVTYYIGMYGGRPLIEKFGKYVLISKRDLDLADSFFAKHGSWSTFIGRLLPVVRTFISIPAGVSRVPFVKFVWFSFIGSFLWTYLLAYVGMKLGENWSTLRMRLHGFDTAIIVCIGLFVVWWVWRHFRHKDHE